jgi:hypothetical protein
VRVAIPAVVLLVLGLIAGRAEAQSCSNFIAIKSYDADSKTVEVSYEKGNQKKYFPKPEGTPADSTKIPKKCTSKVKRKKSLIVKPTGGRMTVTQVRSNFDGKMLNDSEDATWLPKELEKLIAAKTPVVAVIRPGMKKTDSPTLTTIYLPITEAEIAEIARIDAQAKDVE